MAESLEAIVQRWRASPGTLLKLTLGNFRGAFKPGVTSEDYESRLAALVKACEPSLMTGLEKSTTRLISTRYEKKDVTVRFPINGNKVQTPEIYQPEHHTIPFRASNRRYSMAVVFTEKHEKPLDYHREKADTYTLNDQTRFHYQGWTYVFNVMREGANAKEASSKPCRYEIHLEAGDVRHLPAAEIAALIYNRGCQLLGSHLNGERNEVVFV